MGFRDRILKNRENDGIGVEPEKIIGRDKSMRTRFIRPRICAIASRSANKLRGEYKILMETERYNVIKVIITCLFITV